MSTVRRAWVDDGGEFYPRPRRRFSPRLFDLPPEAAPLPFVRWQSKISTYVRWGNLYYGTNYKMYEHRPPVRMGSPQDFFYTYRNQDAAVVNLTEYTGVYVVMKRQGDMYETRSAEFDGDKTLGKVKYSGWIFATDGIQWVQFVVYDNTGAYRYGDPAQVRVVKNVVNLATDEVMEW